MATTNIQLICKKINTYEPFTTSLPSLIFDPYDNVYAIGLIQRGLSIGKVGKKEPIWPKICGYMKKKQNVRKYEKLFFFYFHFLNLKFNDDDGKFFSDLKYFFA